MVIRRASQQDRVIGPFVEGLVAAAAFGALTSTSSSLDSGTVMVAIGMGIAACVFAVGGDWLRPVAAVLYSGLGIVAFVPAVAAFLHDGVCGHAAPVALRWAALVLLVSVASITFAAGVLTLRTRLGSAIGLALFGALQILVSAVTFLTGSGTSMEWLTVAVLVPGAFALGWFVVRATDVVLGVAGAAFAMQSIFTAATGSACGSANASGVVMIVLYCGTYFAARAVTSPFVRGR